MSDNDINDAHDWRRRIDPGRIVDKFIDHLNGKAELTRTQIEVGRILLSKVVPDLARKQLDTTEVREIRIIGGLPD